MALARFFDARFGFAQSRVLRLQFIDRVRHALRHALALGLRFVAAQQPEQLLFVRQLRLVIAVLARHRRLGFQTFHLAAQFRADIFDARQVFTRIGQTAFGFLAPFLVLGHAGGFFQKHAQLVRARFDDARDRSLADDGIGAWPQASAQKEVGHVLAADMQIIDVVLGLPAARELPLDGKLGVLRPLAGGTAERIVEHQFDRRTRHRLAAARTIEDDILHRFAAQFRSLRFAEHPAHGVDHVRFAATVRTNNADELPGQGNGRRIDKGFKTGKFEFGQAHEKAMQKTTEPPPAPPPNAASQRREWHE